MQRQHGNKKQRDSGIEELGRVDVATLSPADIDVLCCSDSAFTCLFHTGCKDASEHSLRHLLLQHA